MANVISETTLLLANSLVEPVLHLHLGLAMAYGWLSITLLLLGRRLLKFAKPDAPYISPLLRCTGKLMAILGSTLIIFTVLLVMALALLVSLAYIASALEHETGVIDSITHGLGELWHVAEDHAAALAGGLATGTILSLPVTIRLVPKWERGSGLPDVEELVRTFKKMRRYDPRRYFNTPMGCFIGKTKSGKNIYVPWAKFRETHSLVMGGSGSGKGQLLSSLMFQFILAGRTLIWFDPKFDRYSPRLMRMAAKQAGRPFIMLNLNSDQPPQLNLLAGASHHEIADLLVAGFDLRGHGTDGDFHRGRDEDAAYEAAELAASLENPSLPAMVEACLNVETITEKENFWRCLKKLARLPVFNTSMGTNLSSSIQQGAVIYIVGSTDSESVKMAQKMLLVRAIQIIKRRDRSQPNTPVVVVLDEFKHLLSQTALTGLGGIRDFDSHFFLAHQSLGDLDSCSGISYAEAYGAVIDNTAIKFIHKIGDGDYAEKLSKAGGKRRTYTENSSKTTENGTQGGSWREAQVPLVNPDLITHLPMPSDRPDQASVGIMFGVGNATLFHLGPIPADGPLPQPAIAPQYAPNGVSTSAKGLI